MTDYELFDFGVGREMVEHYRVEIGSEKLDVMVQNNENRFNNDRLSSEYLIDWQTDLEEEEFEEIVKSDEYLDFRESHTTFPCNDGRAKTYKVSPIGSSSVFQEFEISWTEFEDDAPRIISLEVNEADTEPLREYMPETASDYREEDVEEFIGNVEQLIEEKMFQKPKNQSSN